MNNNELRNLFYEQLEKESEIDSKSSMQLICKIIDDAMEKKDRSVQLFISNQRILISVYPYEQGYPNWIPVEDPLSNKQKFRCPECKSYSDFMTPYCPICGEQLSECDG